MAWNGEHMGIGQATLLSRVSTSSAEASWKSSAHQPFQTTPGVPQDSVIEGYVLTWAGMLIQPDRALFACESDIS